MCKHVEYTGKGYCAALYPTFLELYYRYVLVGVVLAAGVGLVVGACYCFWFKWACFGEKWRHKGQGRYVTLLDTDSTNA